MQMGGPGAHSINVRFEAARDQIGLHKVRSHGPGKDSSLPQRCQRANAGLADFPNPLCTLDSTLL
jgi:hypothetical protein